MEMQGHFLLILITLTLLVGLQGSLAIDEQTKKGDPTQRAFHTVFTRWGRSTCPAGTDEVYTGLLGGSWHGHSGGGTDFVCLTLYPQWNRYKDGEQDRPCHMNAAEFQTEHHEGIFDGTYASRYHDHSTYCAVCLVNNSSVQMMIPAKRDCPSGWTKQYEGYMMTEKHNHSSNKGYICMDKDPEIAMGSQENKDGALLSFVEARCDHGLPCPNYVAGRELTCVVCTK